MKLLALSLALGIGASYEANAKSLILTSPEDYEIYDISPNGKWACGGYNDMSYTYYAFRWNLETGETEILSNSESNANSINDDGIVSGTFVYTGKDGNSAPCNMPGYYKDGAWHVVEAPAGAKVTDGIGYDISNDGHYMTGSLEINGESIPFIWKDGKIYRQLGNATAMPYAISPDGQSASGWEYGPKQGNRTATYWKADGTIVHMSDYESPWSSGRRFSSDGKKILFWGGWDEDSSAPLLKAVYDVETGDITKVPTLTGEDAEFELFNISDKNTLVGQENKLAYIYTGGKGYRAYDYLTNTLGIDLSSANIYQDEGGIQLYRATSISADDNAIGFIYYDQNAVLRSMVVIVDRDTEHAAPASVKAAQMEDINSVVLTWKAPLASTNIKGYNVYRDADKLTASPVNDSTFYDKNVAYGTHDYTVATVYNDGTEAKAEAVKATVAEKAISQPKTVFARQKGMDGAYMSWSEPRTNLINKSYYDEATANIMPFGTSSTDVPAFETAISYSKAEMECYAGSKLTKVAFYPMAEQQAWAINVYTRDADGKLKRLATQPVTQDLEYGKRNVITLEQPIDVPDGELIVGVEATLNTQNYGSVIAMDYGKTVAGHSDLLRQSTEPDFYSLHDQSVQSGYNYSVSWMMDLVLSPEGASDDVDAIDHYNVYADNEKAGQTEDLNYEMSDMADGKHTFGVEAVYANGKVSDKTTADVEIAKRYVTVDAANLDFPSPTHLKATWQAPADWDKTNISYASGEAAEGPKGPAANSYGLMASALYKPFMIKGYDGYNIKSFKFYPTADAVFTFYLYENNTQVSEVEVDDYKLNQWNTVSLPEALTLNENSTYQLVLDCYDVTPDMAPLAVDKNNPYSYYSDLYSLDGSSWNSIADASIYGNWMLGFDIEAPESKPVTVEGYDVRIDGAKKNSSVLKTTEFEYDFAANDGKEHSFNVDVYYPAKAESVAGGATYFTIGTSGINDNVIATINVQVGDNYVRVEGADVQSIEAFTADGAKVAAAKGNVLDINGLASGVHVLKIKTADGKTIVRKVNIKK